MASEDITDYTMAPACDHDLHELCDADGNGYIVCTKCSLHEHAPDSVHASPEDNTTKQLLDQARKYEKMLVALSMQGEDTTIELAELRQVIDRAEGN